MNKENSNQIESKPEGKTTVTFRILPNVKLHIAATAKGLGMSPSAYVEALIMKRHTQMVESISESKKEKPVELPTAMQQIINHFSELLKKQHPGTSEEELIAAALFHAHSNKGALWQRSLNTYLSRIRVELSNQKNNNHDN